MIRYSCPSCKADMQSADGEAGMTVICPTCGHRFQVPTLQNEARLGSLPPEDAEDEPAVMEVEGESRPTRKDVNEKFCHECGAVIRAKAVICPKCGVEQPSL